MASFRVGGGVAQKPPENKVDFYSPEDDPILALAWRDQSQAHADFHKASATLEENVTLQRTIPHNVCPQEDFEAVVAAFDAYINACQMYMNKKICVEGPEYKGRYHDERNLNYCILGRPKLVERYERCKGRQFIRIPHKPGCNWDWKSKENYNCPRCAFLDHELPMVCTNANCQRCEAVTLYMETKLPVA